ncbi:MAG TPA: DUF6600 domain-containing protein [Thermoanaerobaculia bacterium]|nr:DUF6600 domain-containing protein [Thermoanaerobaculia bacterium]
MITKHVALVALLAAIGSGGIASAQPSYSQPPPPDQYATPPDQNLQQPDQDVQQPDQYAQPSDQYGQPIDQYGQPTDQYAQAPVNGTVDISFFYSNLSPHGHWVQRHSYGWVWMPYGIRAGWRPYTLGRWVMTDQGWTWVSDEPFGWATYHYGRWINDSQYGWGWVPGYQWAPAWVAWRSGNGYIGWAPLPPEVRFRAGIGLDFGGVNLEVSLGASHFSFVEERSFLRSNVASYVAPPARNVTIINNTTNITNYTVVNNRVINQGVPVQRLEQVTGQRVQQYQVAAVTSGSARSPQLHGNQLTVFRPSVVRQSATPTPPPSARATASPANLARQHQQEAQTLQKTQVQERSKLQQIHQAEVQSSQSYFASQRAAQQRQQAQQNQQAQAVQVQRQQAQQAQQNQQAQAVPVQRQQAQQRAANSQELAQQHQAELRAQQDQHQREAQQLQARHQAEQAQVRQVQPRQPPPQRNNNGQGGQAQKQQQQRPVSPPPPRR